LKNHAHRGNRKGQTGRSGSSPNRTEPIGGTEKGRSSSESRVGRRGKLSGKTRHNQKKGPSLRWKAKKERKITTRIQSALSPSKKGGATLTAQKLASKVSEAGLLEKVIIVLMPGERKAPLPITMSNGSLKRAEASAGVGKGTHRR